eukprot:349995-Chlamydomonas_euryale.AAC.2
MRQCLVAARACPTPCPATARAGRCVRRRAPASQTPACASGHVSRRPCGSVLKESGHGSRHLGFPPCLAHHGASLAAKRGWFRGLLCLLDRPSCSLQLGPPCS